MIKSKKLSKFKNINHAFFNKLGGVSKGIYKSLNCGPGSKDKKKNVNKNLKIVSKKIGCSRKNLVILNQTHSNKYYFLNSNTNKKYIGDALITKNKGLALGILTADCAPIFIFDPINKVISAIHAGWKGAYKKIISNVISHFLKNGSKVNKLIGVIGPCIGQNNYEVKNDFKTKFLNQSKKNIRYFKKRGNKIYFNLNGYLKAQMINIGLKNIEIIQKDTFSKKNNFFSSRSALKNQENDYGRNISLIMIK